MSDKLLDVKLTNLINRTFTTVNNLTEYHLIAEAAAAKGIEVEGSKG